MTNEVKTLADLLREDGAKDGDIYEACGQQWVVVFDGEYSLHHQTTAACVARKPLRLIPAAGWTRVTPKKLPRVEFVDWCQSGGDWVGAIESMQLKEFEGKRVRVTVEEIL